MVMVKKMEEREKIYFNIVLDFHALHKTNISTIKKKRKNVVMGLLVGGCVTSTFANGIVGITYEQTK